VAKSGIDFEVGRERRGFALVAAVAPRFSKTVLQKKTKATKSCWYFCHQRQKQGLLGNLAQANTRCFVSLVAFSENIRRTGVIEPNY
jgi:hypothetical protein